MEGLAFPVSLAHACKRVYQHSHAVVRTAGGCVSEKLGNSQAPSALACARPGNSHPLKLRIGIPARLAGTNADFSSRDGPENKTQRWVGPSFVFICEVTWELCPRLGIDPAIRPRHGDLDQMAASRAPRPPERSWALSLGCLLPPERGDYSLVALTTSKGGGQLRC